MKTIGKVLKQARVKKSYSLFDLEFETKIKRSFIEAIEKENWKALPDFSVTLGFVKSLAKVLGVNESSAAAFLRRDYPPRTLLVNPKPDISNKFVWSPKLTFLTGAGVILVFILGYLVFQYLVFVAPPPLIVTEPKEGQSVKNINVKVAGKTDPEASLKVNNQPVLVNDDGTFETQIQIFEGTREIVIKATSRAGKESTVRRKIVPEL